MDPIVGGRRQAAVSLNDMQGVREWTGDRLNGNETKLGIAAKRDSLAFNQNRSAANVKEGEQIAAELLHANLGLYCKKWAPPGVDFESKYKRFDALKILAAVKRQVEADALWGEIRNPASGILTGELTQEEIQDVLLEAEEGISQAYLSTLLEEVRAAKRHRDSSTRNLSGA